MEPQQSQRVQRNHRVSYLEVLGDIGRTCKQKILGLKMTYLATVIPAHKRSPKRKLPIMQFWFRKFLYSIAGSKCHSVLWLRLTTCCLFHGLHPERVKLGFIISSFNFNYYSFFFAFLLTAYVSCVCTFLSTLVLHFSAYFLRNYDKLTGMFLCWNWKCENELYNTNCNCISKNTSVK